MGCGISTQDIYNLQREFTDQLKNLFNYRTTRIDETLASVVSQVKSIKYDTDTIKYTADALVSTLGEVKSDLRNVKFTVGAINDTVTNIDSVVQMAFDITEKNFANINRNFEAILAAERRVNVTFVETRKNLNVLGRKMDTALSSIEEAKNFILEQLIKLELKIIDSFKRIQINTIKSKFISFSDYFLMEKQNFNKLPLSERIAKLKAPYGILNKLKESRLPQDSSLYSLLSDILNQNFAIPQDANDELAFVAFDILFYGMKVYSVIVLFLIENYSMLANDSYLRNDLSQYNLYVSTGVSDFNDFMLTFNSLFDKVNHALDVVKGKEFISIERPDILDSILFKRELLRKIKQNLLVIEQNLPVNVYKSPNVINQKPNFKQSKIDTPISIWIDNHSVSYAIQYRNITTNAYTMIGEWSKPFKVRRKANPLIYLPKMSGDVAAGQARFIFRRFDHDPPELVGIVTNSNQTEFLDINREVYNLAQESYEDIAIGDIEFYIEQGADVSTVFEQGLLSLHAAAKSNNPIVVAFLIKNGANVDAQDVNGFSALHFAAEAGYTESVVALLANNADVNVRNNLRQTALHFAVHHEQLDIVKRLLSNDQTKVNAKDQNGFTPLHYSVLANNRELVEALIQDKRTNVNSMNNHKLSSLHLAAMHNRVDLAKIIITDKSDVNAKATNDVVPLHLAVSSGHFAMVKLLLANSRVDVNAKQSDGFTVLHLALQHQKYDIAFELLKHKDVDVNSQAGTDKLTPLHLASINGNKDIVTNLLQKGAKLELLAADDLTALHFAVAHAKVDVVSKLIHFINLKSKTTDGSLPLHYAALSGNEIVTDLTKTNEIIDSKDRHEYTPLYVALKYNNTKVAKDFLDNNANILVRLSDYKTLLHFAAENGDPNAVTNLLANGVNVNIGDRNLTQPLHYAVRQGHANIVQLLLDHGANANSPDRNNMTPLHYVAQLDDSVALEIANILLHKKVDINAVNKDNFTILHIAVQSGNYRLAKFLIEQGVDVNYALNQSSTALHIAAQYNRFNIAKLLLTKGSKINVTNSEGMTPLHSAISGKGDLKMIKLLIENGSNVNLIDSHGFTMLDFAVMSEKMDIVMFLVEKSVDLNALKKDEWTLLHYAAKEGNLRLVKMLLKKGYSAKLEAINVNGETPLYVAIKGKGDLAMVKFMVEMGADLEQKDNRASSLVLEATNQRKFDIAQFLVKRGANVNYENVDGLTPLYIAALDGNYNFVLWLLNNNADINAKTTQDQSVAYGAIKGKGELNLIQLLKSRGAAFDTLTKESITLVHEAIVQNKLDIVEYLIENRVDFNILTKTKDSVMHYAAQKGNIKMVGYLIEKGANIDVTNSDGKTPLHVAIRQNGSLELVKLMVEAGARILSKDNDGYTLLDEAIHANKLDVAQFMYSLGVKLNIFTSKRFTILHHAAQNGMLDFVRLISRKESKIINLKNELGETPLMITIKNKGNLEMVEYFIDNGADVNAKDNNGETLLHEAALTDKVDVARRLVRRDVSLVNSVDNKGYTPLHAAASVDNLEMLKLFFDQQEDSFSLPNVNSKYPIEIAKQNDAKQVVQFLLSARNKSGYTMLHKMAESGNLRMVKFLLENGANANELNNSNFTALHLASKGGHLEIVKFLVEEKCVNTEIKNSQNQTALMLAEEEALPQKVFPYLLNNQKVISTIRFGNFGLVKQFAQQGVGLKCADQETGLTPLHVAAEKGQLEIAKILIEHGVDRFAKAKSGETPLDLAVKFSKREMIKLLRDSTENLFNAVNENKFDLVQECIQNGANANLSIDSNGNTALHVAAKKGKLEIVKYLIEHGKGNIQSKNLANQTVLDVAMLNYRQIVVDYLIEHTKKECFQAITDNNLDKVKEHSRGWDIVNVTGENGMTALHVAAHYGFTDIVQFLLECGASSSAKSVDGSTPLDLARKRNKREVIQSLINTVNEQGTFLLHEAVGREDFKDVRLLLDNKAEINARNVKNETPLQVAVKSGASLEMIKLLVGSGADVQTQDQRGASLVYNAIVRNKRDIIEYLMKKGPGVNFPNNDGWTALHKAVSLGNFELVKYFLTQNSVNIDAQNNVGQSVLHLAIHENGSLSMLILLVSSGANIQMKDNRNHSLVFDAVSKGRLDVVEFLINEKADFQSPDNDGWTPLHEAVKHGNIRLINLLLKNGAKINTKTSDGETPLEIADTFGQLEAVSLLVKFKDERGQTLLHKAAYKEHLSEVKYLLEKGSLVNVVDNDDYMPIHMAAQNDLPSVAAVLIGHGANFCAKTDANQGIIALDLARQSGNSKIANFLESQALMPLANLISKKYNTFDKVAQFIAMGTNINCANIKDGFTALHYAANSGKLDIVDLLLKNGANIAAQNKVNEKALHLAIKSQNKSMIKLLIDSIDRNLGYTLMHMAALNGKLLEIKNLFKNEANIDVVNDKLETPLHLAAGKGHIEICEYLLSKNATIDARNVNGQTPLNYAINLKGDLKMVKLFENNGANLISQTIHTNTYVHGAVARNKLDILDFLITNNVSISLPNNDGQTPLHVAALYDHVEMIDKLLLKGVSVNDKNVHGKTALHVAVSNKIDAQSKNAQMNEETIKRLINAKSEINSRDNSNTTILLESLRQMKLNTTQMLIDKGANVNIANDAGWTAMHEAAKIDDATLIKLLLGKNAQIDAKDKNGQTPLHVLIKANGQLSTVKLLLQKGANVKTKDNSGASLLFDAAVVNRLDIVKELIKRRVDINAPNNEGSTPLHEAAKHDTVNLLSYLIFIAEIDVRNVKGQTAFQVAICANGNMNKLMYFVGKGVNVLTIDNRGSTLLHDAAKCGNSDIVPLLILKGLVDLNTLDNDGLAPLHLAVEHGNLEVIDQLLISSAQIDLIDPTGSTALHRAASKGYFQIVETLVQSGANVDLKNSQGKQAVDLAIERKHFQVAKFLIVQSGVKSMSREIRSVKLNNRKVRNVSNVTRNIDSIVQQAITSSASRTSSWINVVTSSAFDALKSVSVYIFSSNSLPKSTFSKMSSNFVSQSTDLNSSLLLIDVAVRKLTGQRYISHDVQAISVQEARSFALNITERLEKVLIDLSSIWKLDKPNLNYLSFELYKSIEVLVISERYSEIQAKLLSVVKTVYPDSMQNENFVNDLEKEIESIFASNSNSLVDNESDEFDNYISNLHFKSMSSH